MKTSSAGRALITQREGRILRAYRDTRGILTIGVGHTGRSSPPPVSAGMTITEAQCDAFLAADLAPVETAINAAVTVPLSQNEFDALASWLFNVGAGALRRSTILKRLNAGDIAGAAAGFDLYHKPSEIIGRRNGEKAQFLTPDPASGIAAQRAATLATKAARVKTTARAAQAGSGALVTAGFVAAAVTHAHHASIALWLGGGLLVVAGAIALFALLAHAAADTLLVNAGKQDRAGRSMPASPQDLRK